MRVMHGRCGSSKLSSISKKKTCKMTFTAFPKRGKVVRFVPQDVTLKALIRRWSAQRGLKGCFLSMKIYEVSCSEAKHGKTVGLAV